MSGESVPQNHSPCEKFVHGLLEDSSQNWDRWLPKLRAYMQVQCLARLHADTCMGFGQAGLLSGWLYHPKLVHYDLKSYPMLERGGEAPLSPALEKQNSARGRYYEQTQATLWNVLTNNFLESDAKIIEMCDPMNSEHYILPEVTDGDLIAHYDGDERDPYATRCFLLLSEKYGVKEALDALTVVDEYKKVLAEVGSAHFDYEKWAPRYSDAWRKYDNERRKNDAEFQDCMILVTSLRDCRIKMWQEFAKTYFLNKGQAPEHYVMVTLLAAVKSHYRINTHNTKTRSYEPGAGKERQGGGEVAAGLLVKRKSTPGKRQRKLLRAALAAHSHSVVKTKKCVQCHTSFTPVAPQHNFCKGCYIPMDPAAKSQKKLATAKSLLPHGQAAEELILKDTKKRKKKQAQDKDKSLKKAKPSANLVGILKHKNIVKGKVSRKEIATKHRGPGTGSDNNSDENSDDSSDDSASSPSSLSDSAQEVISPFTMTDHLDGIDSASAAVIRAMCRDDDLSDSSSSSTDSSSSSKEQAGSSSVTKKTASKFAPSATMQQALMANFEAGNASNANIAKSHSHNLNDIVRESKKAAKESKSGKESSPAQSTLSNDASALFAGMAESFMQEGSLSSQAASLSYVMPPAKALVGGLITRKDTSALIYPAQYPSDLPKSSEYFPVVDTGATHHLMNMPMFLHMMHPSYESVSWGNQSTSRATGQGSLWGISVAYEIGDDNVRGSTLAPILLYSGAQDGFCVPDMALNLVSVSQLLSQGHSVAFSQDEAGVTINGLVTSYYVPFVYQPSSGYWLMPLYPPPPHTSLLMTTYESGEHDMPQEGTSSVLLVVNLAERKIISNNVEIFNLNPPISDGDSTSDLDSSSSSSSSGFSSSFSSTISSSDSFQEISGESSSDVTTSSADAIEPSGQLSLTSSTKRKKPSVDVGKNKKSTLPTKRYKLAKDKHTSLSNGKEAKLASSDSDELLESVQHKGSFREEYEKLHKRYGHVALERLVYLKSKGIVHSSLIPPRAHVKYLVKDCPVCLAMTYRTPTRPKSKSVIYKNMYDIWEKVYTDTSGEFRIKSFQGNSYYSIFVDEKSGRYLIIAHARKSDYPLIFLKFVAKIGRFPRVLVCDSAGELLSNTLSGTFAQHSVSLEVVPKGEHHLNGPAERGIALVDNMLKTWLADCNLPRNMWDVLAEHATLILAVTRLCPTNKKITVYEAETNMIPNLDQIPPVGCFAVRAIEKILRKDFKFSPANQPGIFLGFGTLRKVFGAILQIGTSSFVSARDNVSYITDNFPHTNKSQSSNPELTWLQSLLQSQNRLMKDAVSTEQISREIEDTSLYCSDVSADGVGTLETFDTDEDAGSIFTQNQEVQNALEQLAIPVRMTRSATMPKVVATNSTFPLKRPSSHDSLFNYEQKSKAHSSKEHAVKTAVTVPFSEDELRSNRTLIIGRPILRKFGNLGNFRGIFTSYDSMNELYRIDFKADSTYELLSFEDILELIPASWLAKSTKANIASVNLALTQAMFNVSVLKRSGKPLCPSAYSAVATGFTEPGSYSESLTVVDSALWRQSMITEIRQLESMNCWTLMLLSELTTDSFVIGCKWVYKLKYKDGVFDKRKSRLVALGYQQEQGRDYFESFSPTCSQISLRLILALTSATGWRSIDMDALSAFISSKLAQGEMVYLKMPKGFDTLASTHCLSLNRCIYGLCQSPRAFFMLTREVYLKAKLTQLLSDKCVFVRFENNLVGGPASLSSQDIINNGQLRSMTYVPPAQRIYASCPHSIAALIIAVYVDNNALRYNCDELVKEFEDSVAKDARIQLHRDGNLEWFLSVRYMFDVSTGAVSCNQEAYIDRLLRKYGLDNCNSTTLPMNPGTDLALLPLPANPDKICVLAYSALIGELLFIAINTAPQISYAVSCLTRYMVKSTPSHLQVAKQVLRYLRGVKSDMIRWCAQDVSAKYAIGEIYGFADASFADDSSGRKSTLAYYMFVNNAVFSWRSCLGSIVATSTTEAELQAFAMASAEILYARKLSLELGFAQLQPTSLYEDNTGCISLAKHMHLRARSKHIALRFCFVSALIESGQLIPQQIASADNVADLGTAARARPAFEKLKAIMFGAHRR